MNKFNLGDKVVFKGDLKLYSGTPPEREITGIFKDSHGFSYKTSPLEHFTREENILLTSEVKSYLLRVLEARIKEVSQWT